MAHELDRFLAELNKRPEHGEGSRIEAARDYLDDVIGMLEPDPVPEKIDVAPGTRLRLVKS
jgi:hypothetical protein